MINHQIHIQTLDFTYKNVKEVDAMEKQVKAFFYEHLLPEMEIVFDEICGPDTFISIDKLVVDIGSISPHQIQTVGKKRLLVNLKKELSNLIQKEDLSIVEKINKHKVQKKNLKIHKEEIFFFFIQNGYFPSSINIPTHQDFNVFIASILESPSAFFAKNTKTLFSEDEISRIRFFTALTKDKQEAFLFLLGFKKEEILFVDNFQAVFINKILPLSKKQASSFWTTRVKSILLKYLLIKNESQTENVSSAYLVNAFARLTNQPLPDLVDLLYENKTFFSNEKEIELIKAIYQQHKFQIENKTKLDHREEEKSLSNTTKTKVGDQQKEEELFYEKSETNLFKIEKEDASKILKEKNSVEEDINLYIENAGLILLHPFLSAFFQELDLMEGKAFRDSMAADRAVHLLHFLVFGNTKGTEHEFVLNKILCGLPVEFPITSDFQISDKEKEESELLLTTVIEHWTALKSTSPDGLRTSFLQRAGKLATEEDHIAIKVEQKTLDILMDKLPWNYSIIKLSWMEKRIQVEW